VHTVVGSKALPDRHFPPSPQNFSGVSSLCLDEYTKINVILKIPTESTEGGRI